MKLQSKINNKRLLSIMVVWILLSACSTLSPSIVSITAQAVTNQPTDTPIVVSGQAGNEITPTSEQTGQVVTPETGTAGQGVLEIHDSYMLDIYNGAIGTTVTASPGKVWVGTGRGTIDQLDSQSGAFVQSIMLNKGERGNIIYKMGFDGQYVAASEYLSDQSGMMHPYLFIIDSSKGEIVHQWDLETTEWKQDREIRLDDLGVSPGKIWMSGHMVDTQTFTVTTVPMPAMARFGYNGKDWMWITGDTGGSCDDLVFVNTDDPTNYVCEHQLPFIRHTGDKVGDVYRDESIMTLAEDRMWMVGSGGGGGKNLTINAYPADMDTLMQQTKPLVTVVLMDPNHQLELLYAGNYLWVLWKGGDKRGYLYQLDPVTGASINSLDLVGDQGRKKGDIPHGFATEGDNLWIVTTFQLLRIKIP
jgi:hypothetical protein